MSVFVLNDGAKASDDLDMTILGDLGKAMARRVGIADLALPLGQPKPGEPRRAVRASPIWQGDGGRGVVVAHVPRPSTISCRIDVSTTSTDVVSRQSKMLEQREVELPASTEFVLLAGYDYTTPATRLSVPNDDDRALWNRLKDKAAKDCMNNATTC